jgi:hypothetical protein
MMNIEELIDNSLNIIKSTEGYSFDRLVQFKKILVFAKKNISDLEVPSDESKASSINIDESIDILEKSGFVVISNEDFDHVVNASVELRDAINHHKK